MQTMESRPVVPDRKLLARLVLIREEARSMMGGGLLDDRNSRGLNTLPRSEVCLLRKILILDKKCSGATQPSPFQPFLFQPI